MEAHWKIHTLLENDQSIFMVTLAEEGTTYGYSILYQNQRGNYSESVQTPSRKL